MTTCFVIQPFDAGKFDKRFNDVYKPAIESAGLEAYRVDKDASVSVPIESIEEGIKKAAICLADITTDNPNVWYELGYAFALNKPVVMICSDERTGKKYPFDIQHRRVIGYSSDSASDFDNLKNKLTTNLKALLSKEEAFKALSATDSVAETQGLSSVEIICLTLIANNSESPNSAAAIYTVQQDAERAGLNRMGLSLGLKRLSGKAMVEFVETDEDYQGEAFPGVIISDKGWAWIDENESELVMHRPSNQSKGDFF